MPNLCRLFVWLLLLATPSFGSPLHAQESPEGGPAGHRSHFPIPYPEVDGDTEQALTERLGRARDFLRAQELWRKLLKRPGDYLKKENAKELKELAEHFQNGRLRIDPDDPLVKQLEKTVEAYKSAPGSAMTPEQLKQIDRFIEDMKQRDPRGKGGMPGPSSPPDVGPSVPPPLQPGQPNALQPPAATQPAPGNPGNIESFEPKEAGAFEQWLFKQSERLAMKGGPLTDSPGVRQAVSDWIRSPDWTGDFRLSQNGPPWADKLAQRIGQSVSDRLPSPDFWQKFSRMPMPNLPNMRLPDFNLSKGYRSVSQFPSAGWPRPSSSSARGLFVAILVTALCAFLVWFIFRDHRSPASLAQSTMPSAPWSAKAADWSAALADIKNKHDLINGFERLALWRLGMDALAWNHLEVAAALGGKNRERRQAAGDLAWLYERARYSPDQTALSADDLARARRDLLYLGGVAPA